MRSVEMYAACPGAGVLVRRTAILGLMIFASQFLRCSQGSNPKTAQSMISRLCLMHILVGALFELQAVLILSYIQATGDIFTFLELALYTCLLHLCLQYLSQRKLTFDYLMHEFLL